MFRANNGYTVIEQTFSQDYVSWLSDYHGIHGSENSWIGMIRDDFSPQVIQFLRDDHTINQDLNDRDNVPSKSSCLLSWCLQVLAP